MSTETNLIVIYARDSQKFDTLTISRWLLGNLFSIVPKGPIRLLGHESPFWTSIHLKYASNNLQSQSSFYKTSKLLSISPQNHIHFYAEFCHIILCLDVSRSMFCSINGDLPIYTLQSRFNSVIESLITTNDSLLPCTILVSIISHSSETDTTSLIWMGRISKDTKSIEIVLLVKQALLSSAPLDQSLRSRSKIQSKATSNYACLRTYVEGIASHAELGPSNASATAIIFTNCVMDVDIIESQLLLAEKKLVLHICPIANTLATTHPSGSGPISTMGLGMKSELGALRIVSESSGGSILSQGNFIEFNRTTKGKSTTDNNVHTQDRDSGVDDQRPYPLEFNLMWKLKLRPLYIPSTTSRSSFRAIHELVSQTTLSSDPDTSMYSIIQKYPLDNFTAEHVLAFRLSEGFRIVDFDRIKPPPSTSKLVRAGTETRIVLDKTCSKVGTLIYVLSYQLPRKELNILHQPQLQQEWLRGSIVVTMLYGRNLHEDPRQQQRRITDVPKTIVTESARIAARDQSNGRLLSLPYLPGSKVLVSNNTISGLLAVVDSLLELLNNAPSSAPITDRHQLSKSGSSDIRVIQSHLHNLLMKVLVSYKDDFKRICRLQNVFARHLCLLSPDSSLGISNIPVRASLKPNNSSDLERNVRMRLESPQLRRLLYQILINRFSEFNVSAINGFCSWLVTTSVLDSYSLPGNDGSHKSSVGTSSTSTYYPNYMDVIYFEVSQYSDTFVSIHAFTLCASVSSRFKIEAILQETFTDIISLFQNSKLSPVALTCDLSRFIVFPPSISFGDRCVDAGSLSRYLRFQNYLVKETCKNVLRLGKLHHNNVVAPRLPLVSASRQELVSMKTSQGFVVARENLDEILFFAIIADNIAGEEGERNYESQAVSSDKASSVAEDSCQASRTTTTTDLEYVSVRGRQSLLQCQILFANDGVSINYFREPYMSSHETRLKSERHVDKLLVNELRSLDDCVIQLYTLLLLVDQTYSMIHSEYSSKRGAAQYVEEKLEGDRSDETRPTGAERTRTSSAPSQGGRRDTLMDRLSARSTSGSETAYFMNSLKGNEQSSSARRASGGGESIGRPGSRSSATPIPPPSTFEGQLPLSDWLQLKSLATQEEISLPCLHSPSLAEVNIPLNELLLDAFQRTLTKLGIYPLLVPEYSPDQHTSFTIANNLVVLMEFSKSGPGSNTDVNRTRTSSLRKSYSNYSWDSVDGDSGYCDVEFSPHLRNYSSQFLLRYWYLSVPVLNIPCSETLSTTLANYIVKGPNVSEESVDTSLSAPSDICETLDINSLNFDDNLMSFNKVNKPTKHSLAIIDFISKTLWSQHLNNFTKVLYSSIVNDATGKFRPNKADMDLAIEQCLCVAHEVDLSTMCRMKSLSLYGGSSTSPTDRNHESSTSISSIVQAFEGSMGTLLKGVPGSQYYILRDMGKVHSSDSCVENSQTDSVEYKEDQHDVSMFVKLVILGRSSDEFSPTHGSMTSIDSCCTVIQPDATAESLSRHIVNLCVAPPSQPHSSSSHVYTHTQSTPTGATGDDLRTVVDGNRKVMLGGSESMTSVQDSLHYSSSQILLRMECFYLNEDDSVDSLSPVNHVFTQAPISSNSDKSFKGSQSPRSPLDVSDSAPALPKPSDTELTRNRILRSLKKQLEVFVAADTLDSLQTVPAITAESLAIVQSCLSDTPSVHRMHSTFDFLLPQIQLSSKSKTSTSGSSSTSTSPLPSAQEMVILSFLELELERRIAANKIGEVFYVRNWNQDHESRNRQPSILGTDSVSSNAAPSDPNPGQESIPCWLVIVLSQTVVSRQEGILEDMSILSLDVQVSLRLSDPTTFGQQDVISRTIINVLQDCCKVGNQFILLKYLYDTRLVSAYLLAPPPPPTPSKQEGISSRQGRTMSVMVGRSKSESITNPMSPSSTGSSKPSDTLLSSPSHSVDKQDSETLIDLPIPVELHRWENFKMGCFGCPLQAQVQCVNPFSSLGADVVIRELQAAFSPLSPLNFPENCFISRDFKGNIYYMSFDTPFERDTDNAKVISMSLYGIRPVDEKLCSKLKSDIEAMIDELMAKTISSQLSRKAFHSSFIPFLKSGKSRQIEVNLTLPSYVHDILLFCTIFRQVLLSSQVLMNDVFINVSQTEKQQAKRDLSTIVHPACFGYDITSRFYDSHSHEPLRRKLSSTSTQSPSGMLHSRASFERKTLQRPSHVHPEIVQFNQTDKDVVNPVFFSMLFAQRLSSPNHSNSPLESAPILFSQNDFTFLYNFIPQPFQSGIKDTTHPRYKLIGKGLSLMEIAPYPGAVITGSKVFLEQDLKQLRFVLEYDQKLLMFEGSQSSSSLNSSVHERDRESAPNTATPIPSQPTSRDDINRQRTSSTGIFPQAAGMPGTPAGKAQAPHPQGEGPSRRESAPAYVKVRIFPAIPMKTQALVDLFQECFDHALIAYATDRIYTAASVIATANVSVGPDRLIDKSFLPYLDERFLNRMAHSLLHRLKSQQAYCYAGMQAFPVSLSRPAARELQTSLMNSMLDSFPILRDLMTEVQSCVVSGGEGGSIFLDNLVNPASSPIYWCSGPLLPRDDERDEVMDVIFGGAMSAPSASHGYVPSSGAASQPSVPVSASDIRQLTDCEPLLQTATGSPYPSWLSRRRFVIQLVVDPSGFYLFFANIGSSQIDRLKSICVSHIQSLKQDISKKYSTHIADLGLFYDISSTKTLSSSSSKMKSNPGSTRIGTVSQSLSTNTRNTTSDSNRLSQLKPLVIPAIKISRNLSSSSLMSLEDESDFFDRLLWKRRALTHMKMKLETRCTKLHANLTPGSSLQALPPYLWCRGVKLHSVTFTVPFRSKPHPVETVTSLQSSFLSLQTNSLDQSDSPYVANLMHLCRLSDYDFLVYDVVSSPQPYTSQVVCSNSSQLFVILPIPFSSAIAVADIVLCSEQGRVSVTHRVLDVNDVFQYLLSNSTGHTTNTHLSNIRVRDGFAPSPTVSSSSEATAQAATATATVTLQRGSVEEALGEYAHFALAHYSGNKDEWDMRGNPDIDGNSFPRIVFEHPVVNQFRQRLVFQSLTAAYETVAFPGSNKASGNSILAACSDVASLFPDRVFVNQKEFTLLYPGAVDQSCLGLIDSSLFFSNINLSNNPMDTSGINRATRLDGEGEFSDVIYSFCSSIPSPKSHFSNATSSYPFTNHTLGLSFVYRKQAQQPDETPLKSDRQNDFTFNLFTILFSEKDTDVSQLYCVFRDRYSFPKVQKQASASYRDEADVITTTNVLGNDTELESYLIQKHILLKSGSADSIFREISLEIETTISRFLHGIVIDRFWDRLREVLLSSRNPTDSLDPLALQGDHRHVSLSQYSAEMSAAPSSSVAPVEGLVSSLNRICNRIELPFLHYFKEYLGSLSLTDNILMLSDLFRKSTPNLCILTSIHATNQTIYFYVTPKPQFKSLTTSAPYVKTTNPPHSLITEYSYAENVVFAIEINILNPEQHVDIFLLEDQRRRPQLKTKFSSEADRNSFTGVGEDLIVQSLIDCSVNVLYSSLMFMKL